MKRIEEALAVIQFYQDNFRNPRMEEFIISEPYDLFPHKPQNLTPRYQWPDSWPSSSASGVYLFLDDDGVVIYIGKANCFGERLSSYCRYGENKTCELKHSGWIGNPRYIITVCVPKETWFENASLEAYLIQQIPTSDNKNGNY